MIGGLLMACTPGMHKTFQYTMAGAATVAFACDALQTDAALHGAVMDYSEANPLNGSHPGTPRIWAVALSQSALAYAFPQIPTDGNPEVEYAKDVLSLLPVIAESVAVWSNAQITDRPMHRCGH